MSDTPIYEAAEQGVPKGRVIVVHVAVLVEVFGALLWLSRALPQGLLQGLNGRCGRPTGKVQKRVSQGHWCPHKGKRLPRYVGA